MNFSPFTTQFAGLPANAVNQFATAKFSQNITTSNGQVLGVVSGGEGGVHYLRPVDGGAQFSAQVQGNNTNNLQDQPQALITLPITMPGAKPGDAQQTVHIQVINPNPIQQTQPKFQMGQMQIPIQSFQPGGTTVLTVAYSPQDGKLIPNHGFPEGMTVVAALQPQDLQLLAQAQSAAQMSAAQQQNLNDENNKHDNGYERITIKEEPDWENVSTQNNTHTADLSEFITQQSQGLPINLQQFLKFGPNTIKYEPEIQITTPPKEVTPDTNVTNSTMKPDEATKPKRKRRAPKKPPKPKPPKPGQVLIATAIDGTVLFCCPECQMAYPEKENLEQHLSVHKIERRYICDICGAGLKRKEHLERHKSGHNPDRPYICSVCMKGFKRKEHLNLHFVIHSGEKNQICNECGKGFYRKDHLRKHAKSHLTKRLKDELMLRGEDAKVSDISVKQESIQMSTSAISTSTKDGATQDQLQQQQQHQLIIGGDNSMTLTTTSTNGSTSTTQPAISLSTVYVPTSDNTTLPVQIQIPQIVTTSCADGTTTSTMVLPNSSQTTSSTNMPPVAAVPSSSTQTSTESQATQILSGQ